MAEVWETDMNALDFIILVILGFCLIRGFFRGIIKEVSSILGVIGGFFAARLYYPDVSGLLSGWVESASYRDMIGFFLVFGLVFITVAVFGIILKYLMKIVLLGWADHLLGVGFGFVKGVLLVSVMLLVLAAFLPKGAHVLERSILAGRVNRVSEPMARFVSKEMREKFNDQIKDLETTWKRHQR